MRKVGVQLINVFKRPLVSSYSQSFRLLSVFANVESAPFEEIWKLETSFMNDTNEKKVDLGIGVYRNEEGKPWVFPVVKKTEEQVVLDKNLNHEYLMFLGMDSLSTAATKLLLGTKSSALADHRAFGIHSLSGTGSLRIGTEFLTKILNFKTVYISCPSWDNHKKILMHGGFADIREYRYWNASTRAIDDDGFLADLSKAPENSVVLLHTCAHNPTGCDPSEQLWSQIADIMKERKLFPFFDSAYQGYASGDLDTDAWAVRHFEEKGLELFCAQSFAKNLGLYGERVGNLTVVLNRSSDIPKLKSQFNLIVRPMYQSPPAHGAKIVNIILQDLKLMEEWKDCLKIITNRIKKMRIELQTRLENLRTPGNWEHITRHKGMFSYTGLTVKQVEYLREKWHIYLFSSGRANMCGLNAKNVDYVAEAFHDTITKVRE